MWVPLTVTHYQSHTYTILNKTTTCRDLKAVRSIPKFALVQCSVSLAMHPSLQLMRCTSNQSAQQPKITVNPPGVILVLGRGSRKSMGERTFSAETSCSFTEQVYCANYILYAQNSFHIHNNHCLLCTVSQ